MYSHIERKRARIGRLRASRWLALLSFAAVVALLTLLAYQAGTLKALIPGPASIAVPETRSFSSVRSDKEVTVRQSRFTGFDKAQQPFSVTAGNATQDENDKNAVHLEEVEAQLKRKTGANVAIRSQNAHYDAMSKTIDLSGKVTIVSADGFVARMEKARVSIEEHRVRSEVPVEVVYPNGVIRSNGMEIIDDGARILFFNRVRATFGEEVGKGSEE